MSEISIEDAEKELQRLYIVRGDLLPKAHDDADAAEKLREVSEDIRRVSMIILKPELDAWKEKEAQQEKVDRLFKEIEMFILENSNTEPRHND